MKRLLFKQMRKMETGDHFKNGASPKSQMSRGNYSTIIPGMFFTAVIFFFISAVGLFAQDKIYYFQTVPTKESNEIKECPQNQIDNGPCGWYSYSNAKEGKLVFYRRGSSDGGPKMVEGQIINGKKEGEWKFIETVCAPCTDFTYVYNYVNDILHGKWARYGYKEKFLLDEGMYVNGKKEGKETKYTSPSLQKISDSSYSETFYINDKVEKYIQYDSNRNKKKEDFYVNGYRRTWAEYNKDGSVKNKGVY